MKDSKLIDLTTGNPRQVLWSFCLPLFASVIFQQFYNVADSFVAGKFIGEDALAAVGNSYEITLVFIAFATTLDLILRVILVKVLAEPFGYLGIWASWPLGWILGTSLSLYYYKKAKLKFQTI